MNEQNTMNKWKNDKNEMIYEKHAASPEKKNFKLLLFLYSLIRKSIKFRKHK